MTEAVTAIVATVAGAVLLVAIVMIGGFVASMLVAMFFVPIEAVRHHRHHPLAS